MHDYFQRGDKEAEQVVNTVYATLQRDAFYNRFLTMLFEVRTEGGVLSPNATKMEENFIALSNYNSSSSEKLTTELWQMIYIGLIRANFALEQIPQMPNVSETMKTRILGETRFLRALFNLHLVMNYGEFVPVKYYNATGIDELEQKPGTDGELWELILSDLQQSQSLLAGINYTNTNPEYQPGRVSLGAATAFLGQAYLFYAQMKNKPEYYQKAADELGKVITQQAGNYALTHNYRDNFTNEREYNEESLFEAGFSYIGIDPWSIDGKNGVECAWHSKNAGMTSGCSEELPNWWNLAPANNILRHYEAGDFRKWMTLWCENGAYYIDRNGVHAYNPSGSQLSMGFPDNPYPKGEDGKYLGFRKYEFDYNQGQKNDDIPSTEISSKFSGMSDINFRIMRYANVLLMYAECQIHGNVAAGVKSAADCIAEVRRRANNQLDPTEDKFQYQKGNPSLPYFQQSGTLSDVYDKSSDPAVQLQHERLIEFFGEGNRYYDIIRWYKAGLLKDIDPDSPAFGNAISTPAQLAEAIKIPTFNGKFLLPVPQYELNTNPKMIGNESNQ
jgi:hypothetical protein